MSKLIDLTGQRFGQLLVLERAENSARRQARWLCRCDCGREVIVIGGNLRVGNTKSCGCIRGHGGTHTRLYVVWKSMKRRCYSPLASDFKYYGGRGIKMCPEWLQDYTAFRDWALQAGYDENAPHGACTIDRIDVNGDYGPLNCRWISMAEQNRNMRRTSANKSK